MSSMDTWRGRVAVVTGASNGIGRAVTARLLQEGMKVAASARTVDRVRAIGEELGAGDDVFLAARCDVRDEDEILAFFGAVRERWGGTDVLVNNAGLGYASPLVDGETERWREMLETNVLGLCVCTREAIADMRRRGDDGQVIHVSSMAAHRVPPGSGVYAASKHAVRALTEGLRLELRALDSGIRVTSVSPGFVETGFAAHYHGDEAAAERTYGRFKVLQPEDVADLVCTVLAQPPHVQLHDLLVRPTRQKS